MDDIYIYDLKSKVWNYLKDVTLPDPRSVCISAEMQVNIFISFAYSCNPWDSYRNQWNLLLNETDFSKFILQIGGKGNYIAIFGGEISESSKGHEGAGGFSNKLILINEETLEVTIADPKNDERGMPLQRGWSSGCSLPNHKNQLVVFGGLSGNDDNPKRLGDLWICTISI